MMNFAGEMTIQKHRDHSLIVWDMNGSAEGRDKWCAGNKWCLSS